MADAVHDHIRSLIAAYALGAVPDSEIPPIRAHILTCEECYGEAEAFAATASNLSELAEPAPLPKGFEEKVLATVRGDFASDSSPVRKARRFRLQWAVLGGVAAVAVAILAFTTISLVGSRQSEHRYQEAVAALIHDPNAITLRGPGGAEAILASRPGGSVLVGVDLGEAPKERDYQLWLMRDGAPTAAETFDVSDDVVVIESNSTLDGYDGAAITVEPDGGSSAPTTEPVLSSS
jgi:Anti-sigma-K factor rskA, C-terminal